MVEKSVPLNEVEGIDEFYSLITEDEGEEGLKRVQRPGINLKVDGDIKLGARDGYTLEIYAKEGRILDVIIEPNSQYICQNEATRQKTYKGKVGVFIGVPKDGVEVKDKHLVIDELASVFFIQYQKK